MWALCSHQGTQFTDRKPRFFDKHDLPQGAQPADSRVPSLTTKPLALVPRACQPARLGGAKGPRSPGRPWRVVGAVREQEPQKGRVEG